MALRFWSRCTKSRRALEEKYSLPLAPGKDLTHPSSCLPCHCMRPKSLAENCPHSLTAVSGDPAKEMGSCRQRCGLPRHSPSEAWTNEHLPC